MKKTKEIRFRLVSPVAVFMAAFFVFINLDVFSQAVSGVQQTVLLADNTKPASRTIVVQESNLVFPEILKGNEAEATDYIEQFSSRRKDYLVRMYNKGKKLLPKAAKILRKYNLPEELKVLMILESAYNPNVVSKAGAVGYWQFMDEVAKEYGLKYVPHDEYSKARQPAKKGKKKKTKGDTIVKDKEALKKVDDRRNFNKATVAAARYLRDRKVNLDGNWLLVVASYNCGVGNVWGAMKKSGIENPSFWDIKKYLPAETQAYVMNFIALNVIYANYNNFLQNNLIFKEVKMEMQDNFETTVSEELVDVAPGRLK